MLWLPSTDCLRYELGDLAEYVDLSGRTCKQSRTRQEQAEYAELGRNCWLFVELGMKACHLVRKFWHGGRYEAFETHMCLLAEQLNATLSNPMRFNEVRSIARSKARWTWEHITPAGFRAVQAARGKKKGRKRRTELLSQVRTLAASGCSQRKIAQIVGGLPVIDAIV